MQVAASYVEYLITGCCALLWILPILSSAPRSSGDPVASVELALLLPLLYVLGMFIDFVSEKCISPLKKHARGDAERTVADIKSSSTTFIVWHSPELSREYEAKSTRDRIARGATLNCLILFFVSLLRPTTSRILRLPFDQPFTAIIFLGLAGLCFAAWWRFEYLSYRFKLDAVETILAYPKVK